MQEKRVQYFDYLRVIATFTVMFLHLSAHFWSTADVNSFEWGVYTAYDGLARFAVPIFVMISGALFLPRDIPIKKLYSKYILRMLTAFLIWSTVYAVVAGGGIKTVILNVLKGHYHMWFVPMIIGLYMCIPLIKPIVRDMKLVKYFLVLGVIFTLVIPEIVQFTHDFAPASIYTGISALNSEVKNMNMHLVVGYVGYFIGGYYLSETDFSRKQRIAIYIAGLIGVASTILLTYAATIKSQTVVKYYFGNYTVNVMLEAVAIFVFFKYHNFKSDKIYKFILKLSKYSFGAYLVHPLILEILDKSFGINARIFNPLVSIPVLAIIVFTISTIISLIVSYIPVLKKYAV